MSEEKKPETALSTFVGYDTKDTPKSVNIKIGKSYVLTDSYGGTKDVEIVSIRKIDNEIVIYFKWTKQDGKWLSTYNYGNMNLDTFKMQLLEYGQLDSIDIIYPQGQ